MIYDESVRYIHSFTRFGSQLGLERMNKLLELMGNPHKKLNFVHIAGTNGKGSTAQMSTRILTTAGYTVGTYTSPFVVDFRERFQVNNKMIEKSEFSSLVKNITPFVNQMINMGMQVTEFEVITAIAFQYFYESKCDIVCLEVGLGGRFDATNVIDTPEVAIITSISLDHVAILGDTIEKIAGEKAGIIKQNSTVVTYPLQHEDALAVFFQQCAKTNSTLLLPNANAVEIIKSDVLGSTFCFQGEVYKIKLAGQHQIYNAVLVIEAMKALSKKGYRISSEDIKQGIRKASLPARFEILSKSPLVILDGAHNKQSAQSLAQTLDKLEVDSIIAIMGMMADKDYESAVHDIGSRCKAIITIPVDNPRAIDKNELAKTAQKYCTEVFAIEDYSKAFQKALSLAGKNAAIVACGSFYMASDMRKVIKSWKHSH